MARRRSLRQRQADRTPKASSAWLRVPIMASPGLPLRILIYARYSTDEQNPRSIEAQVA